MGKEYTCIDERIQRWIERQKVFFVSTAPLSDSGRVNCSPKGLDSFRVLGPNEIGYVDLGGSGIETVAHLKENGRITITMCAFDGPPKIFRFYGTGSVIEPHDDGFAELLETFPPQETVRNFIRIDVDLIRDSCGYGVPNYEYQGQRDSLNNYYKKQTEEEIQEFRRTENAQSIDGLSGLEQA